MYLKFHYHAFWLVTVFCILCIALLSYKIYYRKAATADLIIYNGTIITMDPQRRIIPQGAVVVQGNLIAALGTSTDIMKQYKATQIIDAQNSAILPGFINGHVHAAMTLFRGVTENLSLNEWLQNYILPLEHKYVTPDFVYWGTVLGCLEMISGGITTAVDMYLFEEQAAQAFSDLNMRAIAGYNIVAYDDIAKAETYIKTWKDKNQLVTPAVAPHSPYSCTTEVLIAAKNLAHKYQVPITIHIAETKQSVQLTKKREGAGPLSYLANIHFLDKNIIAAHVVNVDSHDMDLLKKYNVGVIHNPTSNLNLSSGIAPITTMLEKGIAVGLGTDGAASTNSLNLISEMKLAALLQKVHMEDPRALDAQTALELATIRGARAIHRADEIGSIEVGKKADIITISLNRYHQKPLYNIVSQIVFASESSDVTTVIIDGKIVMRNRTFLCPASLFNTLNERIRYYHDRIKNETNLTQQSYSK